MTIGTELGKDRFMSVEIRELTDKERFTCQVPCINPSKFWKIQLMSMWYELLVPYNVNLKFFFEIVSFISHVFGVFRCRL